MRFPIHTILYTKNWYNKRGGMDKYWMDLCHTIYADGWTVFSKHDVAQWCLHRYDEIKEAVWKNMPFYSTSHLFERINEYKSDWKWKYGTELDLDDLVIAVICSYFSMLDRYQIKEWEKPSPDVLPFPLHDAYVSDSEGWVHAEMMCDRLAVIDEQFSDAPKKTTKDFFQTYDDIEAGINIKDYHDVMPLLGSDYGKNIKSYNIKGYILNNPGNHKFDDEHYLSLGIYQFCKFDPDQIYEVRIEEIHTKWDFGYDDVSFKVRSIK